MRRLQIPQSTLVSLAVAAAVIGGAVAILAVYLTNGPAVSMSCSSGSCLTSVSLQPGSYHVDSTLTTCEGSRWVLQPERKTAAGGTVTVGTSSIVTPSTLVGRDGRPPAYTEPFRADFTLSTPTRFRLAENAHYRFCSIDLTITRR
jgi:hypothetical protein